MPFILKKFQVKESEKIQHALINQFGFALSDSQRLLSKARVFDQEGKVLQNGQKIKPEEYIQVAVFEGQTRGLNPIFQNDDFAFFDKPSGVMVHPTSRNTQYTLLDEIRHHFGQSANLAHRIDQETSGLVLVTKNKISDMLLKEMFENKQYIKKYLAVVRGELKDSLRIDEPIAKAKNSSIGVKMCVTKDGKESLTNIKPIRYDANQNTTLVEASPLTGRQHQIRVHLHHLGYPILGDPIYGVDEEIVDRYLLKKLSFEDRVKYTGYERLLLHANSLEFSYQNRQFKIYSKLRLK